MSNNAILRDFDKSNQTKTRAAGGTCWADANRNFNVETDEYVKIWVERVSRNVRVTRNAKNAENEKVASNEKVAKSEKIAECETPGLECFLADTFFIIKANGKILALESYEFVEDKRCESYKSFGDWLVQIINWKV